MPIVVAAAPFSILLDLANDGREGRAPGNFTGGTWHGHRDPVGLLPGEAVLEIRCTNWDEILIEMREASSTWRRWRSWRVDRGAGVLQPIMVRRAAEGGPPGDRRRTAVAGGGQGREGQVPAVVRERTDQQAMPLTVVENLQREDLGIMDQAPAFNGWWRDSPVAGGGC